ncbi:Hypothetical protein POVN_LOCUS423 [uncultured virus]|nr:Hypothetical protein POVN_LOCUS423 [uncultured virus]
MVDIFLDLAKRVGDLKAKPDAKEADALMGWVQADGLDSLKEHLLAFFKEQGGIGSSKVPVKETSPKLGREVAISVMRKHKNAAPIHALQEGKDRTTADLIAADFITGMGYTAAVVAAFTPEEYDTLKTLAVQNSPEHGIQALIAGMVAPEAESVAGEAVTKEIRKRLNEIGEVTKVVGEWSEGGTTWFKWWGETDVPLMARVLAYAQYFAGLGYTGEQMRAFDADDKLYLQIKSNGLDMEPHDPVNFVRGLTHELYIDTEEEGNT